MPTRRSPPRLWLRPQRKHATGAVSPATWIILDLGRQIATRCRELEREEAQAFFDSYIAKNYGGKLPTMRHSAPRVRKSSGEEVVYFVSSSETDNYPIKIGRSRERELKRRLCHLQMSVPHTLSILATMPGGKDRERDMHIAFCRSRIRGEWFARDPDLMDFIKALMPTDR